MRLIILIKVTWSAIIELWKHAKLLREWNRIWDKWVDEMAAKSRSINNVQTR